MLTPSRSGAKYSYRVIDAFQGGTEGAGRPIGTLLRDDEGNLYGTSQSGGTGSGSVFELLPKGGGYVERVLVRLDSQPSPGLSRDGNGALYGATCCDGRYGGGTVFKLKPNGSDYMFSTVFEFQQSTGSFPAAGPIVDAAGALYGTTEVGGSGTFGTVYELTPGGSTYSETVLHDFAGGSDGESALGQLSFVDGNIYGTTPFGGGGPCTAYMVSYGCGTIFGLTPSGSGYVYETIYRFEGQADGEEPAPGLVLGAKGRFYGTTSGGACDYEQPECAPGTIYELSTQGSSVSLRSIHVFPNAKFRDGPFPNGGIIFGQPGILFGTTQLGGSAQHGTVFSMQV